jgi:hypothetical protein
MVLHTFTQEEQSTCDAERMPLNPGFRINPKTACMGLQTMSYVIVAALAQAPSAVSAEG